MAYIFDFEIQFENQTPILVPAVDSTYENIIEALNKTPNVYGKVTIQGSEGLYYLYNFTDISPNGIGNVGTMYSDFLTPGMYYMYGVRALIRTDGTTNCVIRRIDYNP